MGSPEQTVSFSQLREHMQEKFGLQIDMQSFKSNSSSKHLNVTTDSGEKIVVAVKDSEESDVIEDTFEVVRQHLKAKLPAGITIIIPLQSTDGDDFVSFERENSPKLGRAYVLPAGESEELTREKIAEPKFWELLGSASGQLDACLAQINPVALRRYQKLDLKHGKHFVLKAVDSLEDTRERRLAEQVVTMYESIEPLIQDCRHSLIHGNIQKSTLRIGENTTFLDFHDCLITQLINEVAICVAQFVPFTDSPLEFMSRVISAYHKEHPLQETELQVLPYLIILRLLVNILDYPTLESTSEERERKQKHELDNSHQNLSREALWRSLRTLLDIPPPVIKNLLLSSCDLNVAGLADDEEIVALRKKHLSATMSSMYAKPLHLVQGYMQYMYSASGRQYLDMRNNVCHVGHCNPRIVAAAHRQIATLNTNTRYLHQTITEYAQKILQTLPSKFEVCFFVNSGTEANDLALRLSEAATGGRDVIALDYGYHGTSMSVAKINGQKFTGKKETPWNHLHRVQRPGEYRENSNMEELIAEIEQVIETLEKNGEKLSAYIAESACGVAGQVYPPKGYFRRVYDVIRKHGGICIADEVQVGFGRVGKKFWAFELDSEDTIPDIVTMGKPAGNGHPLSIVATTKAIAEAFDDGREYFNTFGGNPVSCAIGLEVLKYIQEEGLQKRAYELGEFFKKELNNLRDRFPVIGDVRGEGLFLGIELVLCREKKTPATALTSAVVEKLKEAGILIGQDGPDKNVLCIKPPLVIEKSNLQFFTNKFAAILSELTSQRV